MVKSSFGKTGPSGSTDLRGALVAARPLGEVFDSAVFAETEEDLLDPEGAEVAREDPVWSAVQQQMIQASCAFFAQEILRGPDGHPYNGRFVIGEHHEEWDELLVKHDRLCILAPRDHGKCQRGDALVISATGARVRLDEWDGGHVWAYDPEKLELRPAYAPPAQPNGVRPVILVRTKSGREVVVTENHPLRLFDRWIEAQELQIGQRIAAPKYVPSVSTIEVPDAWARGVFLGDEGFCGGDRTLALEDPALLAELRGYGVELHSAEDLTYRVTGCQAVLRSLGLVDTAAYLRRVPTAIFEASTASVAEFLAGFLDAAGFPSFIGGGLLTVRSSSEMLLRDVQHLLLRLGVLSTFRASRGQEAGRLKWGWRLSVRGDSLRALARAIRLRGSKQQELADVVAAMPASASDDDLDCFPAEVWKYLPPQNRLHGDGLHAYPSRRELASIAESCDCAELRAVVQAPVFWDEVVALEEIGEAETWGLQVPGLENYLADDLVNHNTFFWDFAVPLWKATNQPNGSGFIFSATQEQASRILADIRHEVESNHRLQWLLPSRRDKWSTTHVRFANGHQIYARGFGTRVRGAHPTWIVVDDSLNDETAYSQLVRQKQIDYFFTAITNMVVPGGQIVVVGTPFHAGDLYGELSHNSEYEFRRYRAIVTGEDGKDRALWPERYDVNRLRKRREEIGAIRFTREFQCDPTADDMSLFPGALFRGVDVEQPTVSLGMPLEFWQENKVAIYIGVDFAMSTSVSADYTVIWTMGVDSRGNRWIVDIQRERGLGFQEQLSLILQVGKKYDPALIFLEANQMQRIFGDELIRTTDLPIKQFVTTAINKNALDKGVPSLRVLLENRKFRIPRGDARSVSLIDEWVSEMRSFTWADGKLQSVGLHDDMVMACWICDQAIRAGGFSWAFDEEGEKGSFEDLLKELCDDDPEPKAEEGPKGASGDLVGDGVFGGTGLSFGF